MGINNTAFVGLTVCCLDSTHPLHDVLVQPSGAANLTHTVSAPANELSLFESRLRTSHGEESVRPCSVRRRPAFSVGTFLPPVPGSPPERRAFHGGVNVPRDCRDFLCYPVSLQAFVETAFDEAAFDKEAFNIEAFDEPAFDEPVFDEPALDSMNQRLTNQRSTKHHATTEHCWRPTAQRLTAYRGD